MSACTRPLADFIYQRHHLRNGFLTMTEAAWNICSVSASSCDLASLRSGVNSPLTPPAPRYSGEHTREGHSALSWRCQSTVDELPVSASAVQSRDATSLYSLHLQGDICGAIIRTRRTFCIVLVLFFSALGCKVDDQLSGSGRLGACTECSPLC